MIVSVQAVVAELESLTDESAAYLNRETGELYRVGPEEANAAAEDADPDDIPGWLLEEVPKIRAVLASEEWLPLPSKFDIDEWSIMDHFTHTIDDAQIQKELRNAIRGRGAFRLFKEVLHRRGIQESWYRYREDALAQIASDWLEGHGLAYTRGDAEGEAR